MVKTKDWKRLNWVIPIAEIHESVGDNWSTKKAFTVSGVAISASTSRNGITYIDKELEKSAESLLRKPLLIDHSNKILDIAGRITSSLWDPLTKSINFKAEVMETKIKEMLRDGRIADVSVGASVKDLKQQKDGTVHAIGIEFLELSLVAVPGIVDQGITSIDEAIAKNVLLKEQVLGKPDFTEYIDEEEQEKIDKQLDGLTEQISELTSIVDGKEHANNSEIKRIEVIL